MKAQTARCLRQLHRQIGLFFTPAILFFALSGAFQTLGWHESRGGSGPPAQWIAWMASVHKDQRLPHPRPKPVQNTPGPRSGQKPAEHHEPAGPSPVPLKAFVICLAIGLIFSSALGAVIALTSPAMRRSAILSLALGLAVPALLLFV